MNTDENIINNEQEMADDVTFEELNSEGDTLSPQETIKKLRERIKKITQEKQEYLLGWQRMKADYANSQRLNAESFGQIESKAKAKIIHDILPVLDSFELAMGNTIAWEKVDAAWRTGVEYIAQQLREALLRNGVEKFGVIGDKFDPSLHQPISHESSSGDSKEEYITKVIQPGYKFANSVLRPAKVIVGNS